MSIGCKTCPSMTFKMRSSVSAIGSARLLAQIAEPLRRCAAHTYTSPFRIPCGDFCASKFAPHGQTLRVQFMCNVTVTRTGRVHLVDAANHLSLGFEDASFDMALQVDVLVAEHLPAGDVAGAGLSVHRIRCTLAGLLALDSSAKSLDLHHHHGDRRINFDLAIVEIGKHPHTGDIDLLQHIASFCALTSESI